MNEFFATSTSYPTVVFTVLLGVSLALGLLVLMGAIGPDLFAFDVDVDADAELGLEGSAPVEGAAQPGQGILGSLLGMLKPKNVPALLALSVWSLFGWVITGIMCSSLLPSLTFAPPWATSSLMGVAGATGAFVLTSLLLRPLGRVFKPEVAARREDIVGQIVVVDTSRVTSDFGSAKASDGGSGLVIAIRCSCENSLTRSSKALVVAYDAKREVYEVTSVKDIVPSEIAR